MPITITEIAAAKIKELILEKKMPETTGLRLGIMGGGCHGMEYRVDLVSVPDQFDVTFENFGARIFCDKKSYLFLNGTIVDYQKTLMTQGFVFTNPNAKGTCGCGKTFSI